MRYLFLTLGYHPDIAGGAYRYVTEVAERLVRRGRRVDVICPKAFDGLALKETRNGVCIHRFPNTTGFFYSNWKAENLAASVLAETVLGDGDEPCVIILCHAFLAPATEMLPCPQVFFFTGPWGLEYGFSRSRVKRSPFRRLLDVLIRRQMMRVERRALKASRSILTISRYYSDQLPAWHGNRLPRIGNVSGGVDLKRFQPVDDREMVRTSLGLKRNDFLWLTVRRLDARMGLAGLVTAFGKVANRFPDAKLWLAGKGPELASLSALIAREKLSDRVKLLGFVSDDDLPRLLNAADCTVMPSLDLEGFGLSTVESLACGTPVLGSDAGATPELLRPLDAGMLFPAGDEQALAMAMEKFMNAPGLLPPRSRCWEYAAGHFDWDNVVSGWEEFVIATTGKAGS